MFFMSSRKLAFLFEPRELLVELFSFARELLLGHGFREVVVEADRDSSGLFEREFLRRNSQGNVGVVSQFRLRVSAEVRLL